MLKSYGNHDDSCSRNNVDDVYDDLCDYFVWFVEEVGIFS